MDYPTTGACNFDPYPLLAAVLTKGLASPLFPRRHVPRFPRGPTKSENWDYFMICSLYSQINLYYKELKTAHL